MARIQVYILLWLAMLCMFVWGLGWLSSPVSGDKTPVYVSIPSGANAAHVAKLLDDAGVIRAQRVFLLTVGLRGAAEQLKPGMYKLDRSMTLLQIIHKIVRGEVSAKWLTIPEGYTAGQIAGMLAERGIADEDEFLDVALRQASRFAEILPVSSESLEGYLFPDTYLFPEKTGSEVVIREMLSNFKKKVEEPLRSDVTAFALNPLVSGSTAFSGNLHQIVTLASLIEREARKPKDRPLVSSVLWNRLRRDMPLQIDATVQYALGEHRTRLFYRDYETPSEYNTYLHKGLPPGPIANPGLASIEAALKPVESNYLYYVASGDGSHVFTCTLDEHNRAVAASRRARNRSEAP